MRRWIVRLSFLVVLLVCAAVAAGWILYQRTHESFRGYAAAEQFVDVASGQSSMAIGRRLVEAGVVRDELTFRGALLLSGRARDLKAGEYRFDQPLTAVEVIDRIAKGDVYKRMLTFAEGLTLAEMAKVFEERGFGTAEEFSGAARDSSLIRDLDAARRGRESCLFSGTNALP